ncbi:MAG: hypothetical protein HY600_04750 [Candidatus Omnitrophica bacterium]|nr:hypothetical protein [Candidatus Omnitrophota bacterium]
MSAPAPFQFSTRLTLREATGLQAVSLGQLLRHLKTVPGSVVFHHTHHYLQQHQSLTPEPPNDFAYWVTEVLGDKVLGEQLASVDTVQCPSIRALRDQLAATLERALRARPLLRSQAVPADEAFHFIKAVSVVLPTPYHAATLPEFLEALQGVTIDSLYFHVFEARLRLERGNDFARWFEALGEPALARKVAALDPYTHTMEELRQTIVTLVRRRVGEGHP